MKNFVDIDPIDTNGKSQSDIARLIGEKLGEEFEKRKKLEKLSLEMALASTSFRLDLIRLSKKYDKPVRELMWAAVRAFMKELELWSEADEDFSAEDHAAYEEMRAKFAEFTK